MSYAQPTRPPLRWPGIFLVVAVHLLAGYVFVSGLAVRLAKEVQATIEVSLLAPVAPSLPATAPTVAPPAATPTLPARVMPVPTSSERIPNEASPTLSAPTPSPSPVIASAEPAAPPPLVIARTAAVIDARACSTPDYPPASRRAQEEGVVTVEFLVGIDGLALDSRVAKSSGFRRLDEAARRALALCRFKPGSVDGRPVQSWARIDYQWKLE